MLSFDVVTLTFLIQFQYIYNYFVSFRWGQYQLLRVDISNKDRVETRSDLKQHQRKGGERGGKRRMEEGGASISSCWTDWSVSPCLFLVCPGSSRLPLWRQRPAASERVWREQACCGCWASPPSSRPIWPWWWPRSTCSSPPGGWREGERERGRGLAHRWTPDGAAGNSSG